EQTVAELVEAQKRFQQTLEEHNERLARLERIAERHDKTLEEHSKRLEQLEKTVAELVEAQKRFQQTLEKHDERLTRLEQTVADLVEAQKRFQQTLEEHNERLARLERIAERHDKTLEEHSKRLEQLEKTVAELVEAVRNLVRSVEKLEQRLGKVSGFYYEFHFRERAPAYFGRILRRTRGLLPQDIEQLVEPHLSKDERADLYRIDLIVRGLWEADGQEVYFATEVSETIDANDVARALQRVNLLRKAGLRALPAAAGGNATPEAQLVAQREKVLLITDGTMENLEAIEQSLSAGS
ncbi:MAG: hypothetical protein ACUVRT_14610, partial [Armatimonadota bacterium]